MSLQGRPVAETAQPAVAAAPPATARDHASPEHPRQARLVVCEGHPGSEHDPLAERRAERRAVHRLLADAALRMSAVQGPMPAALLLAGVPPCAVLLMHDHSLALAAAWSFVAVAAAAALWFASRHAGGNRSWWIARLWHVAVVLVALCAALPPWWVSPQHQPLLALGAAALGMAGAGALAPLPWPALSLAAVPLVACAALASAGWADESAAGAGWPWLAAGAFASASAVALLFQRHQAWRQHTKALMAQGQHLRQLQEQRDAAEQADGEKSRFLAIASHDLRQPVHALGLFAATLQKRLQRSPDEPLARNLMRAIDALERSFNAMLDISRLDGGAQAPRLQTFPLRDLFRRLQMQYAGLAELSGLGLRFSPGGRSVTSDPQLLERILGNLVQNAVKHTHRGGIVVVARRTATHVNVEVWDTGSGIPADELPQIFNEFYQVGRGERDRSQGLGMGLAIVKRLARLLGHRLEVCSAPGRGTMFRIGIAIGGLPGIQEELAPADTLPMIVQTPQMVLVIDDEEPIREGLRLLMQEWGYQVMTAANGTQAEEAMTALEGRVDLVLSDLHLGDGPDGQEVIAALRRLCGRELPAVLVTGDTTHEEAQRMAARGDPVLLKPVQPRRLFDALRAALG